MLSRSKILILDCHVRHNVLLKILGKCLRVSWSLGVQYDSRPRPAASVDEPGLTTIQLHSSTFFTAMYWISLALLCPILLSGSTQAVTVYGQAPLAATSTAPGAKYTGLKAYDPTVLNPPPIPNPAPAAQYTIQLIQNANGVTGLSVPTISGSFLGFSIEVSVINQVCECSVIHRFLAMSSHVL